jgi:hypothetical protein
MPAKFMSSSSARLNVFQRLVRQWDTVHPYNAAQALRIAGKPDVLAIRRSWHATLSALELGPVRVQGRDLVIEAVNGNASRYTVPVIDASTLCEHISRELNHRFTDAEDQELPLRPFIIEDGESFYMGIVYQHWLADSASIRMLLKEWFSRAYDPAAACDAPAVIPRGGYWAHFGPTRARWRLGEQLLTLLRSASRFRRVRKLRTQGSVDFRMKFALHRVPSGMLQQLLGVARRNGVTLNDLFLAAIADVCDRFNPIRRIPRRRDLALGMIVDLRSRSRRDMSRVFGLFLGFANVVCKRDDLRDWPRLVRQISQQTRVHKQTDAPQASSVWMFAALAAARFVPVHKTFRFYRKHMPLAGGISNVNLNQTWAAKYYPDVIKEYVRVSPTGPMVPLVFTTTTLGDELMFGLTYRAALFSEETADKIAATFLSRLEQLAECGDALLRE